ncbi:MAG: hypothetical protein AB7P21_30455 [Lautropia sp.]
MATMTLRLDVGDVILELSSDPLVRVDDKRLAKVPRRDRVQQWRVRAPDLHASALLSVSPATLETFRSELEAHRRSPESTALLVASQEPASSMRVSCGADGEACLSLILKSGGGRTEVSITVGLSQKHVELLHGWVTDLASAQTGPGQMGSTGSTRTSTMRTSFGEALRLR